MTKMRWQTDEVIVCWNSIDQSTFYKKQKLEKVESTEKKSKKKIQEKVKMRNV